MKSAIKETITFPTDFKEKLILLFTYQKQILFKNFNSLSKFVNNKVLNGSNINVLNYSDCQNNLS